MYGSPYSSSSYDYVNRYDDSPFERVKQQYWTAKQAIISKLGKKEDDSLIASDAEFDAKLMVFESTKQTCESLLRCIEHYQDYICDLSQEENALGRFLKDRGKADKTQAGKMMAAVGRAQSYTAHQRLAIRVPLVRLYQELDVFTKRAVADCFNTVEAAMKARMEYRGSLLRMKDISQQLDPDTYKHMEKFRVVQAQVRRNKAKFDKLKLDCLQKIDLLAASRCNLFSQVLASYQQCLMRFWDKTAKVHSTISDSFKGYQHYEFTVLKDLAVPSLHLAKLTAGDAQENADKNDTKKEEEELIALGAGENPQENLVRTESLENLFKDSPVHEKRNTDDSMSIFEPRGGDNDMMTLSSDIDDFLKLNSATFRNKTGDKQGATATEQPTESTQFFDQFLADVGVGQGASDNSFTKQWQQNFGVGASFTPPAGAVPRDVSPPVQKSAFQTMMPSQLLDLQPSWLSAASAATSSAGTEKPTAQGENAKAKGGKNAKSKDMSAWFNLFADIDPLQNPDAVGKNQADADRGC